MSHSAIISKSAKGILSDTKPDVSSVLMLAVVTDVRFLLIERVVRCTCSFSINAAVAFALPNYAGTCHFRH
ncbi:predicted protein [Botrytis cinerea T4]|uniref:Uncharacterized protein n=1 Tax=Botryotinia fuckeliana (strain T4) TaxID=999810 RepID=G2YXX0_BOTF4|nr:predicted protein [Botrytis cinerea T4]